MYPFIPLFVLSWVTVFLAVALLGNIGRVMIGATSFTEAKPAIAIIMLCLVIAFELFGRIFWRSSR